MEEYSYTSTHSGPHRACNGITLPLPLYEDVNWLTCALRRDQHLVFNGLLFSVEVGSDCYLHTYSVSLTYSGVLMGYENFY
jgi:hypothetical protein